jgi:hypothetical protein
MIKRLVYVVLGFWLVKKYVLPRFGGDSSTTWDEEV